MSERMTLADQRARKAAVNTPAPPPRLYVIPAVRAPIAVVFARRPGNWWMLARWDLASDAVAPGAWFHGSLFPRRSEVSPDGELLYYFAYKTGARDWIGTAFSAVSKVPWVTALAAWRECGTWTRGYHFVEGPTEDERAWDIGWPDAGDAAPVRARWGLARTEPEQFSVERRRGWTHHEASPARAADDIWDEKRRSLIVKPRPGSTARLVATDRGYQHHEPGGTEGRRPGFRIELGRRSVELQDAVWADWDARGRLLVATLGGWIQVRDGDAPELAVVWQCDMGAFDLARKPAPREARRW